MNDVASMTPEWAKKQTWLHYWRCPIVPEFRYRASDEQNTASIHIGWLVFRAWTMDSPDVGFEVTLDDQQLQMCVRFPYLITGLFIPLFPESWGFKLWRKSAIWKAARK